MSKAKIRGIGNIILTEENPKPETEYLISLRCELRKIEKDISDKDNPEYTYIFEYLNTELMQEIGTAKRLKVEHGKSWAQKIRWALETLATKKGIDPDIFYEEQQKKRLNAIMNEIEE